MHFRQRRQAVLGRFHAVSFVFQSHRQKIADALFVIHNQNARFLPSIAFTSLLYCSTLPFAHRMKNSIFS